jgi:ribose transport system permease protein
MAVFTRRPLWARLLSEHGIVLALILVAGYYSVVTLDEQNASGPAGGEEVARAILKEGAVRTGVLIVVGHGEKDGPFADAVEHELKEASVPVLARSQGHPRDARKALLKLVGEGKRPDVIAATHIAGRWALLRDLEQLDSALAETKVVTPHSYRWPNFLMPKNLLNIANQIAVILILAIGMTLVIITGGIDLSVGSLIALSAVVATLLIRDVFGAEEASTLGMVVACAAAVVLCAVVGLGSGVLVTLFGMPPFIVTLGIMLIARGVAFKIAQDQSIYQVPDSFIWLGRGANLAGIPNAVVLVVALVLVAHIVMTRMTWGRYIYATGGNAEAARLAGVSVKRVLLAVYIACGALAGLGGVVMASQLQSGSPTYGQMYELSVIAAVVVGGTSLSGGEGRIVGTLLGALLIAVIQNGMNLTGVESNMQMIVLGVVILGAVLLDRLKKRVH